MENKNNNKFEILEKNNFIYFTLPKSIKTKLNDKGKEKKELPFPKDFSWNQINKDNYKNYINHDDKTFFIITGKESNLTVLDIDNGETYEKLLEYKPELKDYLTIKTNRGYHIYFKYEPSLKNCTDINNIKGFDIRNDGGIIVAPPTKYKLLDGKKVKYEYLYGEVLDIPEFLLNKLIPKEKETNEDEPKEEKPKTEIIFNEGKTKEEYIERLIDLLDDSRADDRTEWTEVSFIINNELGKAGLNIFKNFSSRSDKYDEITDDKWFMNLQKYEKGLYIGSLIKKVKEDNEEEYKELKKEFVKAKDNELIKTLNCEEKQIAKYIINKYLKDEYMCVLLKPTKFYYFNNHKWTEDKSNNKLFKILNEDLENDYYKLMKDSNDEVINKKASIVIKKLNGKLNFIDSIIEWISRLLFNIDILKKFDENQNLMGFNNGVYEFSTKTFRDGKPSDYITKSVNYDFPTEDKGYKSDIDKFLNQVFPDPEIKKYILQLQAQSLCGHKIKDLVITHTGRGGNGKSILIKLLSCVFGDYFIELPTAMITSQNKGTHNTPDPFMSEIQGCRYAVANEPKNGLKLNDSIVKIFGSQESFKYRMLYSNEPVTLNTQIKLNIFCNNKLDFDGNDGGLLRRLKVVKYISKFDEKPNEKNNIYKIDYNLSKTVELWKEDYMKMLINLYDPNYEYNEPLSINKWSSDYCDDNNDVKKFVKDNFELTNNSKDYLLLKDLKLMYQHNKEYEQTKLKNLKEHLEKEFNADFKEKAKIKINDKWIDVRSVIFGWKKIKDDDDDEDDKTNLDI